MQKVKLTEGQRDALSAEFTRTLIQQARQNADPETRDNARALLDLHGIRY